MSWQSGQLTTDDPTLMDGVFRQTMRFRSERVKIDGQAIEQVVGVAMNQFRLSLQANGLDEYKWPPERVEVTPERDFKGALFLFTTHASKRKPYILL